MNEPPPSPVVQRLTLQKRFDVADALARVAKAQLENARLRLDVLVRSDGPKTPQQLEVCRCDLRVKEIEDRIARVNRRQLQRSIAAHLREERRRKEGKPPLDIPKAELPKEAGCLGWEHYITEIRGRVVEGRKNLVELSARMTYALTTFVALVRLGLTERRRITVHFAGADWKEGRTVKDTVTIFEELFTLLAGTLVQHVDIALVGPHIESALVSKHVKNVKVVENGPTCSLLYSDELYHTFHARMLDSARNRNKTEGRRTSYDDAAADHMSPDVVFACNAGVWVFDEWTPTVLYVDRKLTCPLVITSYNLHEAVEDRLTLEEIGIKPSNWCWTPELNAFRSLNTKAEESNDQASECDSEKTNAKVSHNVAPNTAWQCVWSSMPASLNVSMAKPLGHFTGRKALTTTK